MKMSDQRTWQEEFTGKEVHPDFPPLPRAIVKYLFNADRRILDRAIRFNLLCHKVLRATRQDNMPELMGNEKSAVKF